MSAEFSQQRNYLDELYKVYPITPNLRREISKESEHNIRQAFHNNDNEKLIRSLLDLDLFPKQIILSSLVLREFLYSI